ncbi:MAG TPA: DUF4295 family protein [Balneolaceae bacterium]|nr:DUF4295 family protein [Balneolaceae bacterium]
MAKKQKFGDDSKAQKGAHRKMAKVIISKKNDKGKYFYKETMLDQDKVNDYISKHKS